MAQVGEACQRSGTVSLSLWKLAFSPLTGSLTHTFLPMQVSCTCLLPVKRTADAESLVVEASSGQDQKGKEQAASSKVCPAPCRVPCSWGEGGCRWAGGGPEVCLGPGLAWAHGQRWLAADSQPQSGCLA